MKFRILNKDPMYDYREANKITQGISSLEDFNPKDEVEWWIKQIISNHSTLRCVRLRLIDTQPRSVIMQIIRATKGHPQPEVESSRPDWHNGKERSSDPYEEKLFMQDHTAESFIEMAKQRLCMKTEARTRQFMIDMVQELRKSEEPFLQAVGYCCAPQCVWNGNRCNQIKPCNEKITKLHEEAINIYKRCKNK